MSRKVSSFFNGGIAGLSLVACLLALAAIFVAPSLAEAATGQIATINWRNSTGTLQGYELEAMAVTNNLATVTLSGPGLSVAETMIPISSENGITVYRTKVSRGSSKPQVGAVYRIKVVYVGNVAPPEDLDLPITAVLGKDTALNIDHFPTQVAPSGSVSSVAPPTFYWNSPKTLPSGFAGYRVAVSGPDLFEWYTEVPTTETSTEYTGSALTPGATYEWAVATMDNNGNKAEIRGGTFIPGATVSGKVTDINGLPLSGIQVRATDVTTSTTYESVFTTTDGTYQYKGLAPGRYKIDFDFASYYWKNRLDPASADILEVADGASVSNVNAVIRGWGALTGSLYVTGSFKPAEAKVELLNLNKLPVPSAPATVPASVIAAQVPLSSSGYGAFYLAPIRPGTYYLRFSAPGYGYVDKQVVITENDTLDGVDAPWAMLSNPLPATLTVQTSGSGTGTVTSAPAGISCASGSTAGCSSSYTSGTAVTLNATPALGSVFGGWSGAACTGTSCVVTVGATGSVTAIFNTMPATVRIDGNSTPYFSIGTALDALLNVTTLQTVRAKGESFAENAIMVKAAQVLLKGGYTDDAFTARTATSKTTIDGSLKIRNGKLTVERLAIK